MSVAETIAARLIDAGCVSFQREEPYRLPSGWASPGYIDCRRLISFPALRSDIVQCGIELLRTRSALPGSVSIVGGESSGIALAAFMAQTLNLPLQYVRKRAVGDRQIEGVLHHEGQVLLVDDMMAAGSSKSRFVHALRDAGATVLDVFVVFDYATFDSAELMKSMGLRLHSLVNWHDVLSVAQRRRDFAAGSFNELERFLLAPADWSQAHGGKGPTNNKGVSP